MGRGGGGRQQRLCESAHDRPRQAVQEREIEVVDRHSQQALGEQVVSLPACQHGVRGTEGDLCGDVQGRLPGAHHEHAPVRERLGRTPGDPDRASYAALSLGAFFA
jgi:hypothetical protein